MLSINRRRTFGFVLTGISAGLLLAGVSAAQDPSTPAAADQVAGNEIHIPVAANVPVAFADASSQAGLTLRPPRFLPATDQLTEIIFPADSARRAESTRYAEIAARGSNGGFLLTVTNGPIQAPLGGVELGGNTPALTIWQVTQPEGITYVGIGADQRGYVLQTHDKSTLSEADAKKTLEGLLGS